MKAKGGYSQGGARATGWQYSGGQGVHQVSIAKMKSEGHEEKYRTTIDGETQDEPVVPTVGQGRVRTPET
jgi:hypothetical protein